MDLTAGGTGAYALGIDIGTSFSVAVAHRDGRSEPVTVEGAALVPSMVAITADGVTELGPAAMRRAASEPERLAYQLKRRIGDSAPLIVGGSPFSAESLTARLLRWLVDQAVQQHGGAPRSVAVTHPAHWGPFKRERLDQVVRIADLQDVVMLAEPAAAALAQASDQPVEPGALVGVYNLGAGGFEAAVVRRTADGFEVVGTPEGLDHPGGIDIDALVVEHVGRATGGQPVDSAGGPEAQAAAGRLRLACIRAKEALATEPHAVIPVESQGTRSEVRLTRSELDDLLRPALADTLAALRQTIASAAVGPEALARVVLVGGSSRLPLVAQLVGQALGRPVVLADPPDQAIAMGAALAAAHHVGVPSAAAAAGGAMPPPPPPPVPAPPPPPIPTPIVAAPPPAPTDIPDPVPLASTAPPPAPAPPVDQAGASATSDLVAPADEGPPPPVAPAGAARPRWLPAAAVAGVLVVTALVAATFFLLPGDDGGGGGGGGGDVVEADEVSQAGDVTALEVTDTVAVGDFPDGLAYDSTGKLWVASSGAEEVSVIDPQAREVVATYPAGPKPLAVLDVNTSVWVSNDNGETVTVFNSARGNRQSEIEVPFGPAWLSDGAGSVWVASTNPDTGDGAVSQVDPSAWSVVDTVELPRPSAVVAQDDQVWISYGDNQVRLARPGALGEAGQDIEVGDDPDAVALGAGALWVCNRGAGTISRIDTESAAVTATIDVGTEPAGIAVEGNRVWVIDRAEGTLVLIDAETNEVVQRVEVGAAPLGLVVDPDVAWVTLSGGDAVVRVAVT